MLSGVAPALALDTVRVASRAWRGKGVDWAAFSANTAARVAAFAAMQGLYSGLGRAKGLPETFRRLLAALPAGYFTPEILASLSFARGIHRRFLLGHLSIERLWVIFAMIMNYQLWTAAEFIPRSVASLMEAGAGFSFEAAAYRSRTRCIVACDDVAHGIHPGEASCLRSAVTATLRGLPSIASLCGVASLVRAAVHPKERRWGAVVNYVRSVLSLVVQIQIGRTAFCLQSRLAPSQFKPWLGPIVGLVACQGIYIERPELRESFVLFNVAHIVNAQIARWQVFEQDSESGRWFFACMFALSAALDGKGFK